jgi:hydrogenase nickel incorporation protein HypA/HybF
MHEASIALSILETVVNLCRREGYQAVESVRIRVGKGSNILPDALSFAFDAAKLETIAGKAELIIEEVPIIASCKDCRRQVEMEGLFVLDCPECGSGSLRIVSGYEMEIVDMEVPD